MDTKVFVFSSLFGRNSLRKHQNADGSLGTFPIVIFLHKKCLGILLIQMEILCSVKQKMLLMDQHLACKPMLAPRKDMMC